MKTQTSGSIGSITLTHYASKTILVNCYLYRPSAVFHQNSLIHSHSV